MGSEMAFGYLIRLMLNLNKLSINKSGGAVHPLPLRRKIFDVSRMAHGVLIKFGIEKQVFT